MTGDSRTPRGGNRDAVPASDMTHVVLAFDDNRLVGDLFGQFDQNLALIEQRLGVDAVARGNGLAVAER